MGRAGSGGGRGEGEHPVKERRQCDEAKTVRVGGATPAPSGNKTVQVEKTNGSAGSNYLGNKRHEVADYVEGRVKV